MSGGGGAGSVRLGRTMAAAALSTVLASLPVFLLGGLAVLVREDLRFGEQQLGLAVSVFFSVAALSAVPAGRLVARWGARLSTVVAAWASTAALVTMALAPVYAVLLAGLVLAGAGNALAQIGSNEALARTVPRDRQGLAFGVKQAAVPAAALLAGLSLPLLGLTLGWRLAFAGAALLSLGCVALIARSDPGGGRPVRRGRREAGGDRRPLVVVAVAGALGAGAAGGLSAFLVLSSVSVGLSPARAGLLLAGGSALGALVRLLVGWRADFREGGHLVVVAAMLAAGAVGMFLLSTGRLSVLVPGTLLAFALGWGWPGLLNLAVVRLHPTAPAAATGISQGGVFAGGALGPVAFGTLVEIWSYRVAWLAAGTALLLGALLMRQGRRMMLADLQRRSDSDREDDR